MTKAGGKCQLFLIPYLLLYLLLFILLLLLLYLLLFLLLLLLLLPLLLQIESRSSARIQFAGCLIFQDFDALNRRQQQQQQCRQSYAVKELRSRS